MSSKVVRHGGAPNGAQASAERSDTLTLDAKALPGVILSELNSSVQPGHATRVANFVTARLAGEPKAAQAIIEAFVADWDKLPKESQREFLAAIQGKPGAEKLYQALSAKSVDRAAQDTFERGDANAAGTVELRATPTAPDVLAITANPAAARKAHGLPSETELQEHLTTLEKTAETYARVGADPKVDQAAKQAAHDSWKSARDRVGADLTLWTSYAESLGKHSKALPGAKARVASLEQEFGRLEALAPKARSDRELIERALTVPLSLDDAKSYTSTGEILAAYRAAMTPPYKRPAGVSKHHFRLGVSLRKEGISEKDVMGFLLEGEETPAIQATRKKLLKSGNGRAANAMAALIELRASSVRAQNRIETLVVAAERRTLDAMAETDPQRTAVLDRIAERQEDIAGLEKTQATLRSAYRATYRDADAQQYAVGKRDVATGQVYLGRAAQLDTQVAQLETTLKDAQLLAQTSRTKKDLDEVKRLERQIKAKKAKATKLRASAKRALDRGNAVVLEKAVATAKRIDKLADKKVPAHLRDRAGEAFAVSANATLALTPHAEEPAEGEAFVVPAEIGNEEERNAAAAALAAGKGLDAGTPLPEDGAKPSAVALIGLSVRYGGAENAHNEVTLDAQRKALGKIAGYERIGKKRADDVAKQAKDKADTHRENIKGWMNSKTTAYDDAVEQATLVGENVARENAEANKLEGEKVPWANRYWAFRATENTATQELSALLLTQAGSVDKLRGANLQTYKQLQRDLGAFDLEAADAANRAEKAHKTVDTAAAELKGFQEAKAKADEERKKLEDEKAKAEADRQGFLGVKNEQSLLEDVGDALIGGLSGPGINPFLHQLEQLQNKVDEADKKLKEFDDKHIFRYRVYNAEKRVEAAKKELAAKSNGVNRTNLAEAEIGLEQERAAIGARWYRMSVADRDAILSVAATADFNALQAATRSTDTPNAAKKKAIAHGEAALATAQKIDDDMVADAIGGRSRKAIAAARQERARGSTQHAMFLARTQGMLDRLEPPLTDAKDGYTPNGKDLMSSRQRARVAQTLVTTLQGDVEALKGDLAIRNGLLQSAVFVEAGTAEAFVVEAPKWAKQTIESAKVHANFVGDAKLRGDLDLYVAGQPARMLHVLRTERKAVDLLDTFSPGVNDDLVALGRTWIDDLASQRLDDRHYQAYLAVRDRTATLNVRNSEHSIHELTKLFGTPVANKQEAADRSRRIRDILEDIDRMREADALPAKLEQLFADAGENDLGKVARAHANFEQLAYGTMHALFIDKFRREAGDAYVRHQRAGTLGQKKDMIDDAYGGIVFWEWGTQDREMEEADNKDADWGWRHRNKAARLDAMSADFETGLANAITQGDGFSYLMAIDILGSRPADFEWNIWNKADQWVANHHREALTYWDTSDDLERKAQIDAGRDRDFVKAGDSYYARDDYGHLPEALLTLLTNRGVSNPDLKDNLSDFPGLMSILNTFDPSLTVKAQDPRSNRQITSTAAEILAEVGEDWMKTAEELKDQMLLHTIWETLIITVVTFGVGTAFAAGRAGVAGAELAMQAAELAAASARIRRTMSLVRAMEAMAETASTRGGAMAWRAAASLTESMAMQVKMFAVQKTVDSVFGERSTVSKVTAGALNFWGFWHQPRIAGMQHGSVYRRSSALLKALAPQILMNEAQAIAGQTLVPEMLKRMQINQDGAFGQLVSGVTNAFVNSLLPAGMAARGTGKSWKAHHAEASALIQAHLDAGAQYTAAEMQTMAGQIASRLSAFHHSAAGKAANAADIAALRNDFDKLFDYDKLPEGERAVARLRTQKMVETIALDHAASIAANELDLDGRKVPSRKDARQAVERTATLAITSGMDPVLAYQTAAKLWGGRFVSGGQASDGHAPARAAATMEAALVGWEHARPHVAGKRIVEALGSTRSEAERGLLAHDAAKLVSAFKLAHQKKGTASEAELSQLKSDVYALFGDRIDVAGKAAADRIITDFLTQPDYARAIAEAHLDKQPTTAQARAAVDAVAAAARAAGVDEQEAFVTAAQLVSSRIGIDPANRDAVTAALNRAWSAAAVRAEVHDLQQPLDDVTLAKAVDILEAHYGRFQERIGSGGHLSREEWTALGNELAAAGVPEQVVGALKLRTAFDVLQERLDATIMEHIKLHKRPPEPAEMREMLARLAAQGGVTLDAATINTLAPDAVSTPVPPSAASTAEGTGSRRSTLHAPTERPGTGDANERLPTAVQEAIKELDPTTRGAALAVISQDVSEAGQQLSERAVRLLAGKKPEVQLAVWTRLGELPAHERGELLTQLELGDRLKLLDRALIAIPDAAVEPNAGMLVDLAASLNEITFKRFAESDALASMDGRTINSYLHLAKEAGGTQVFDAIVKGGDSAVARAKAVSEALLPATGRPELDNARRLLRDAAEYTNESGMAALLTQAIHYETESNVTRAISRLAEREWFTQMRPDDQVRAAGVLAQLYSDSFNSKSSEASRRLAKADAEQLLMGDPPLMFEDHHSLAHGGGITLERGQVPPVGGPVSARVMHDVTHEINHHVNVRAGLAPPDPEPTYRNFMLELCGEHAALTRSLGRDALHSDEQLRHGLWEFARQLLEPGGQYPDLYLALTRHPAEGAQIIEYMNQFLREPLDPQDPRSPAKLLDIIKRNNEADLKPLSAPAPRIDRSFGFIENNELSDGPGFVPGERGVGHARPYPSAPVIEPADALDNSGASYDDIATQPERFIHPGMVLTDPSTGLRYSVERVRGHDVPEIVLRAKTDNSVLPLTPDEVMARGFVKENGKRLVSRMAQDRAELQMPVRDLDLSREGIAARATALIGGRLRGLHGVTATKVTVNEQQGASIITVSLLDKGGKIVGSAVLIADASERLLQIDSVTTHGEKADGISRDLTNAAREFAKQHFGGARWTLQSKEGGLEHLPEPYARRLDHQEAAYKRQLERLKRALPKAELTIEKQALQERIAEAEKGLQRVERERRRNARDRQEEETAALYRIADQASFERFVTPKSGEVLSRATMADGTVLGSVTIGSDGRTYGLVQARYQNGNFQRPGRFPDGTLVSLPLHELIENNPTLLPEKMRVIDPERGPGVLRNVGGVLKFMPDNGEIAKLDALTLVLRGFSKEDGTPLFTESARETAKKAADEETRTDAEQLKPDEETGVTHLDIHVRPFLQKRSELEREDTRPGQRRPQTPVVRESAVIPNRADTQPGHQAEADFDETLNTMFYELGGPIVDGDYILSQITLPLLPDQPPGEKKRYNTDITRGKLEQIDERTLELTFVMPVLGRRGRKIAEVTRVIRRVHNRDGSYSLLHHEARIDVHATGGEDAAHALIQQQDEFLRKFARKRRVGTEPVVRVDVDGRGHVEQADKRKLHSNAVEGEWQARAAAEKDVDGPPDVRLDPRYLTDAEVLERREITSQRYRDALERKGRQPAPFIARLEGVPFGEDVRGVSPEVIDAIDKLARSQWAAVDVTDSAHPNHVTGVIELALRAEAQTLRRPLQQWEVDRIVLEAIGSNGFGKGLDWRQNRDMPVVPLLKITRNDVGTISHREPLGTDRTGSTAGALGDRVRERAPELYENKPDLASAMTRGIQQPSIFFTQMRAGAEIIARQELSRGGRRPSDADVQQRTGALLQQMYEAHLASGISAAFDAADVMPDFAALRDAGAISEAGRQHLERLWTASIEAAWKTRDDIDDTGERFGREGNPDGYTLDSYIKNIRALGLDKIVAELPEHMRRQVVQAQQIGPLSMEGLLGAFDTDAFGLHPKRTDLLITMAVRRTVAPAHWQALAYGTGKDFEATATPTLARIGVTYDAELRTYRQASINDQPAHATFARAIAGDELVMRDFLKEHPRLGTREKVELRVWSGDATLEKTLVDWMRARSVKTASGARADMQALVRMAQREPRDPRPINVFEQLGPAMKHLPTADHKAVIERWTELSEADRKVFTEIVGHPLFAKMDPEARKRTIQFLGSAHLRMAAQARTKFLELLNTDRYGSFKNVKQALIDGFWHTESWMFTVQARPGTFDHRRAHYEVEPPRDVGMQQIRGVAVQAQVHVVVVEGRRIEILAPKHPRARLPSPADIAKSLAGLPAYKRARIARVDLSDLPYGRAKASASHDGIITFYAQPKEWTPHDLDSTFRHEAGHVLSMQLFGYDYPMSIAGQYPLYGPDAVMSPAWRKFEETVLADGIPISEYGRSDLGEHFSEMMSYFDDVQGTPEAADAKRIFPHQWALFEQLVGLQVLTSDTTPNIPPLSTPGEPGWHIAAVDAKNDLVRIEADSGEAFVRAPAEIVALKAPQLAHLPDIFSVDGKRLQMAGIDPFSGHFLVRDVDNPAAPPDVWAAPMVWKHARDVVLPHLGPTGQVRRAERLDLPPVHAHGVALDVFKYTYAAHPEATQALDALAKLTPSVHFERLVNFVARVSNRDSIEAMTQLGFLTSAAYRGEGAALAAMDVLTHGGVGELPANTPHLLDVADVSWTGIASPGERALYDAAAAYPDLTSYLLEAARKLPNRSEVRLIYLAQELHKGQVDGVRAMQWLATHDGIPLDARTPIQDRVYLFDPDRAALRQRARASSDKALRDEVLRFAEDSKVSPHAVRFLEDALALGGKQGQVALAALKNGFDPAKASDAEIGKLLDVSDGKLKRFLGWFRGKVGISPREAGEALRVVRDLPAKAGERPVRQEMLVRLERLTGPNRAAYLHALRQRKDDLARGAGDPRFERAINELDALLFYFSNHHNEPRVARSAMRVSDGLIAGRQFSTDEAVLLLIRGNPKQRAQAEDMFASARRQEEFEAGLQGLSVQSIPGTEGMLAPQMQNDPDAGPALDPMTAPPRLLGMPPPDAPVPATVRYEGKTLKVIPLPEPTPYFKSFGGSDIRRVAVGQVELVIAGKTETLPLVWVERTKSFEMARDFEPVKQPKAIMTYAHELPAREPLDGDHAAALQLVSKHEGEEHVLLDGMGEEALAKTLVEALGPDGPGRLVLLALPDGRGRWMVAERISPVGSDTLVTFRDSVTGQRYERTLRQLSTPGKNDFSIHGLALPERTADETLGRARKKRASSPGRAIVPEEPRSERAALGADAKRTINGFVEHAHASVGEKFPDLTMRAQRRGWAEAVATEAMALGSNALAGLAARDAYLKATDPVFRYNWEVYMALPENVRKQAGEGLLMATIYGGERVRGLFPAFKEWSTKAYAQNITWAGERLQVLYGFGMQAHDDTFAEFSLANTSGGATAAQRKRLTEELSAKAELRDTLAHELLTEVVAGRAPPHMHFDSDIVRSALLAAYRGSVDGRGDAAGALALLGGARNDSERSAMIALMAGQTKRRQPFDADAILHGIAQMRRDGTLVDASPKRSFENAKQVVLPLKKPPQLAEQINAVPARDKRAQSFGREIDRLTAQAHTTFDATYGKAIADVLGRSVSRAALEHALTPPLPGYRAEIVAVSDGRDGGFTLEYHVRDAGGRVVAVGKQGAHRADDGHLVWDMELINIDVRYQDSGLGALMFDQAILMLDKLRKPGEQPEIQLRADLVGKYYWAKDFAFRNTLERDGMRKDFKDWVDKMARVDPRFTHIADDLKRLADTLETPRQFRNIGLNDAFKLRVTDTSNPNVNIAEAPIGRAYLLGTHRAWDGSLFPFDPVDDKPAPGQRYSQAQLERAEPRLREFRLRLAELRGDPALAKDADAIQTLHDDLLMQTMTRLDDQERIRLRQEHARASAQPTLPAGYEALQGMTSISARNLTRYLTGNSRANWHGAIDVVLEGHQPELRQALRALPEALAKPILIAMVDHVGDRTRGKALAELASKPWYTNADVTLRTTMIERVGALSVRAWKTDKGSHPGVAEAASSTLAVALELGAPAAAWASDTTLATWAYRAKHTAPPTLLGKLQLDYDAAYVAQLASGTLPTNERMWRALRDKLDAEPYRSHLDAGKRETPVIVGWLNDLGLFKVRSSGWPALREHVEGHWFNGMVDPHGAAAKNHADPSYGLPKPRVEAQPALLTLIVAERAMSPPERPIDLDAARNAIEPGRTDILHAIELLRVENRQFPERMADLDTEIGALSKRESEIDALTPGTQPRSPERKKLLEEKAGLPRKLMERMQARDALLGEWNAHTRKLAEVERAYEELTAQADKRLADEQRQRLQTEEAERKARAAEVIDRGVRHELSALELTQMGALVEGYTTPGWRGQRVREWLNKTRAKTQPSARGDGLVAAVLNGAYPDLAKALAKRSEAQVLPVLVALEKFPGNPDVAFALKELAGRDWFQNATAAEQARMADVIAVMAHRATENEDGIVRGTTHQAFQNVFAHPGAINWKDLPPGDAGVGAAASAAYRAAHPAQGLLAETQVEYSATYVGLLAQGKLPTRYDVFEAVFTHVRKKSDGKVTPQVLEVFKWFDERGFFAVRFDFSRPDAAAPRIAALLNRPTVFRELNTPLEAAVPVSGSLPSPAEIERIRVAYSPHTPARDRKVLEAAANDPDATIAFSFFLPGRHVNTVYMATLSNGLRGVWKPLEGEYPARLRDHIPAGEQAPREVAAYLIDAALGHVAGVAPSVMRSLNGQPGVLTVFLDGTVGRQASRGPAPTPGLELFDYIAGNVDRNVSNYLLGADGSGIPIDHGAILPVKNGPQGYVVQAFKTKRQLNSEELQIVRNFIAKRQQLTADLLALRIKRNGIWQPAFQLSTIDAMFTRAQSILDNGSFEWDWTK